MTAGTADSGIRGRSWLGAYLGYWISNAVCIVLCLTPVTAVVVLGWLTRKTANDVEARLVGQAYHRPNLIFGTVRPNRWMTWQWLGALAGGLWLNFVVGIRAWIAVLVLLAPFELIWLASWFAGWENSFNKGYELSGVWPITSLAAVLLSLPVLTLVPMAIAHQAVQGRIASVTEFAHDLPLDPCSRSSLSLVVAVDWDRMHWRLRRARAAGFRRALLTAGCERRSRANRCVCAAA